MAEDLKPLLMQLINMVDQRFGAIDERLDRIETDLAKVKSDVIDLKTGQAVIAARLDEQRSTINALIPTRIAAIPGRADAAE